MQISFGAPWRSYGKHSEIIQGIEGKMIVESAERTSTRTSLIGN